MTGKYSVLLLYPESDNEGGTETYYAAVEAEDKAAAIEAAKSEAVLSNDWELERGEEFAVLLVIEGHHKDLGAY